MSQDVLDTGFIHPDEMKEIGDTNYPALGSNGNERQWIGVARYQVARGFFCTFEGTTVADVVKGFAGVNGDAPTEIEGNPACLRMDRGRPGEAWRCPSAQGRRRAVPA
jgi:hypothetical protein